MTTSGAYAFNPSVGEITMQAYARIGIRRNQIEQEHLLNARMETNAMFVEWANKGPNLWDVDLQSTPLVQGTATYSVSPTTIMILDAYITTGTPPTDRIMTSVSRTEYASYPNKTQQGFPSIFWFDRLVAPSVTLYLTPDGGGPYTLNYYRFRQIQDAALINSQTAEVPYRFLDAMMWGLASRLAYIYAPDRAATCDAKAQNAWTTAATQDTEDVPMTLVPDLSSYYRI